MEKIEETEDNATEDIEKIVNDVSEKKEVFHVGDVAILHHLNQQIGVGTIMSVSGEFASVKLHKWYQGIEYDFMEEYEIGSLVPWKLTELEKFQFN